MFQQMLKYLEKRDRKGHDSSSSDKKRGGGKTQQDRMPVRKYYNNVFKELLNDAIFALKKQQSKS